jgi:class 3 adenylate cyclase
MSNAARRFEPERFEIEREIALPRAQLWRVLSHTDHMNRAVGLASVTYEEDAENPLLRWAASSLAGQDLQWREFPFEWVAPEGYSILREYTAGPLARFYAGVTLNEDPQNSSVTRAALWLELTPADDLGAQIAAGMAGAFLEKIADYCQEAARDYSQNSSVRPVALPQPVVSSPIDSEQLAHGLARLSREYSRPQLVEKLGRFLETRGDAEVARIRPFVLAAQWSAPREEILRLCLLATRCGLLNLSWNLMCPNCRVCKEEAATLSDVGSQVHCNLCGVNYDLNFDRYVELTFRIHPSVRVARDEIYCIAGPFMSPHVLSQQRVAAGGSTPIAIPAERGELRLRVLGANHSAAVEEGQGEDSDFIYTAAGWNRERVLPARKLRIENHSENDIWVVLEKTAWDSEAASAALVTAMPEFRRWFGSEVLAPGNHVAIESLTLFFSDLRDSAQLYESSGDAPAYGRVRKHFDFLFERIEANNGAIVKTIGDAVMAVFQAPENALRAALAIQNEVENFNAALPPGENLAIKIGLHHGPAIAINSNGRLDYFGRVVNIASRVGEVSAGDDIVLSNECFSQQVVKNVIAESDWELQTFATNLKGFKEKFELHRVQKQKS